MKALVVYDSVFGNIRRLAEAMAAGLNIRAASITNIGAGDQPGRIAADWLSHAGVQAHTRNHRMD